MTIRTNGPRAHGRLRLAASLSLAAIGAAAFATPAVAGSVETANACKFSYDQEYRTQAVVVTAAAPVEASAGQTITLTGERLEVKLREQLAKDAAAVGLIPSDGSTVNIVTKTWIALKGTNTAEGTQVIGPIEVRASTSALLDEASQTITAEPFTYLPPRLPDTTWTSTGGNIEFSQAGPGAITAAKGPLPIGNSQSPVTVQGSTVVQANMPPKDGVTPSFFMDCQPGETIVTRPEAGAGTSLTPLVATPFATTAVTGPATNPGGTPPPGSGGGGGGGGATTLVAGRISSTSLSSKANKVKVRVSCPVTGADCAGTLTLRTRAKVKLGKRKAKLVTLARSVKYSVAKGKAKTITLSLGLDGKNLVKRKRTQAVTLVLKPTSGKSATKNLTLRRG